MKKLTSADRYDRATLAPGQERLVEWVGSDKDVLEFGASTGYMSAAMVASGCRVTGVEIDEEALTVLRTRATRAYLGDLENPETLSPIHGETFDVVMVADVLEHLREPADVLALIARYVRPGGRVLISMPNVAFWRVRLDLLRGRWEMTPNGILDETHLRFFTQLTAERMYSDAGYEVVRTESVWSEVPFDNRVRAHAPRLWHVKERFNSTLQSRYPRLFTYQYLSELRQPALQARSTGDAT